MRQTEANRDALKKIYDLFFAGDIAAMSAYLVEDAIFSEVASLPYAGEFVGPDGLAELAGKLMETWDDLTFDISDILASDDCAAGIGVFSGVARATGQRVSIPMAEVWTFRNGKVIRCEPIYGDTALVRQATGMGPL